MRRLLALILLASVMCTPHEVSAQPTARQGKSIAIISIPRIKLISQVYVGVTNDVFDVGVGKWPGSPDPGKKGNLVLGGHRTSGTHPFMKIDQLRSGDVVTLIAKGKTHLYRVTGYQIVKPTALWITNPTLGATLTLFACHPLGKTTSRYVVRAVLSS
jgi:sortase A